MKADDEITFKAKYFFRLLEGDWNPFTPDIIQIDDQVIEHKRRNWYLISVDTQTYHFQNILGVDVNKGLFGATIVIKSAGNSKIEIRGFSKKTADEIKKICKTHIHTNTQRGTTDALASAISRAVSHGGGTSTSDELKKLKELLDGGAINHEEFETQKRKILNS